MRDLLIRRPGSLDVCKHGYTLEYTQCDACELEAARKVVEAARAAVALWQPAGEPGHYTVDTGKLAHAVFDLDHALTAYGAAKGRG